MGNRRGLMLITQHQASPSARPPPPRARGRGLALRWHWQVRVVRARGQASRRELAPHSALVPSSPCLPCPESRASSVRSSRPVVLRRSSATLPRADSQQRAASATTTTCRHLGHRAGPRHLSSSSAREPGAVGLRLRLSESRFRAYRGAWWDGGPPSATQASANARGQRPSHIMTTSHFACPRTQFKHNHKPTTS